jgi:hypothetical protein
MQRLLPHLTLALALLWGAGCGRGDREHGRGAPPPVPIEDQEVREDSSLPAVVLDPDDEAFREMEHDASRGQGSRPEAEDGKKGPRGPVFTVKGVVKSTDPESGAIVVDQMLADGRRHDVRFRTDDDTHVGWSKASMKMGLADLLPGTTVYVTYHVMGSGSERHNQATKVIIPGGMEDVAKMILGEPEGTSSGEKPGKGGKKHGHH